MFLHHLTQDMYKMKHKPFISNVMFEKPHQVFLLLIFSKWWVRFSWSVMQYVIYLRGLNQIVNQEPLICGARNNYKLGPRDGKVSFVLYHPRISKGLGKLEDWPTWCPHSYQMQNLASKDVLGLLQYLLWCSSHISPRYLTKLEEGL